VVNGYARIVACISGGSGFIIAADAGGTHTRVACFGLDGALIGSATGRAGSPYHNAQAAETVAETTIRALRDGGLDAADAIGLVAGLADISIPGSGPADGNDWADGFFVIPSLGCDRVIVNDAVVAHRGALLGQPGVIVVAGTGSMILAITEDGTPVESGQFGHYAGGARHVAAEAMQLILAGAAGPGDVGFVASVLDYWGAADVPGLRRAMLGLAGSDPMERARRYGLLAPAVTAAADTSSVADRALRDLAGKTARGVQLLAPLLVQGHVPVATAGALATTPAFTSRLRDALYEGTTLVPAVLDPLRGAALIAYQRAGIDIGPDLIDRLLLSQTRHANTPPPE
jgi:glucosamine kinase